ncbi:MAG: hypothetical protein AB1568_12015 [Thermodesulfobacteriota bacterium]
MILSIDESIQRLKAEILSQDWRLTGNRADLLEAAFACLRQRFRNRKAAHDILTMAGSVLAYVRRHGDRRLPTPIGFLKEAMAHVVNMYEEPTLDLERDRQVFHLAYKRFLSLKKNILEEQGKPSASAPPKPSVLPVRPQPTTVAAHGATADSPPPDEAAEGAVALEPLVQELKSSLRKAEEVGTTIRQLLVEILARGQAGGAPDIDAFIRSTILARQQEPLPAAGEQAPRPTPAAAPPPAARPTPSSPAPPPRTQQENGARVAATIDDSPQPCPATGLVVFGLSGLQLAVEQHFVAAHRPLPPAKRSWYLKENMVPLRDFGSLFHSLASRFAGPLGELPSGKLKHLSLPILAPRGFHLPDPFQEEHELTTMLLLSHGHWHGILLCSGKIGAPLTMTRLQRHRDGDIAGTGFTDDGPVLPLLDAAGLLQREGNLVLV